MVRVIPRIPSEQHYTGSLPMKHRLEAWRMWGHAYEGVLLIKRRERAGSRLLRAALRGRPEGSPYLNRTSRVRDEPSGSTGMAFKSARRL
jgi:hypothetical protein